MTKTKANRILTEFLKKIAEEETEMVCVCGEDKLVTKAEALTRLIWKMALGYSEEKVTVEGIKTIEQRPDRGMMGVIFDRIEGRAVPVVEIGKEQRGIADKVTEQGKDRISKAGEVSDN